MKPFHNFARNKNGNQVLENECLKNNLICRKKRLKKDKKTKAKTTGMKK